MKTYQKEAILAPLFKLLEAALELVVPLVVAAIIDNGIGAGDKSYIVKACLFLVAFGGVGLAFSLTAQYFSARAAVGVSASLRGKLFSKIQSFSYAQIDGMGTSTFITRMTSDVNQVQTGVNMTLRLLLRSPFIVFGAMAMAFFVDARAALVFVGVIPLLAAVVFAVMGATMPLYKRVQERLDGVFLSTRENLAGVRVIRAFRRDDEEREEFSRRNGALSHAQKKVGKIAALTNPLTYVVLNLAAILLVYVGAIRVDAGVLEQGQVVALYGYLSQILVELVKLANLIVTITRAVTSQKRIGKILDEESEPSTLLSGGEREEGAFLRFENVTFSYGAGAPALDGVSFCVKEGETVGVIGGTGAGKSTLVNLIPRFYTATEGRVLFDGADVRSIPAEALREKVAVVPQKAVLFKGSIRENLLWGNANCTDDDLNRAISIAQAEDIVAAKGGLDAEVAQEGKNLSGGQRQRLTIARALVRKPRVLILDDSSSALDYATDAKLREALKNTGSTLFLVSQRTASIRHADQILVLDDGELVGVGKHEELLKNCETYAEIHRSQFGEDV